jgi:predicted methyltransferase
MTTVHHIPDIISEPKNEAVENDNYAEITENYKKSKQTSWRKVMETPSFLNLVGQLSNEDILDLACGEGFYTRIMRE